MSRRLPLLALACSLAFASPAFAQDPRPADAPIQARDESVPAVQKKPAVQEADSAAAPASQDGEARPSGPAVAVPNPDSAPTYDDSAERAQEAQTASQEKFWRDRFRDARQRVERLEKALESDKKALADPAHSGIPQMPLNSAGYRPPNPEMDEIKKRIPDEEKELAQAREDLADLDRQASRQAVPQYWRR